MNQVKDQKGHDAAKQTPTAATPSKDSTFCTEHNKDKALCAGQQHVNHGKPVTGSEQHKEQHKK